MTAQKLSLSHSPKNEGPLLLSSIAPGLLLPSFLPSFLTQRDPTRAPWPTPWPRWAGPHSLHHCWIIITPDSWTGAPPPWKSFNYLPPTSCTVDVQFALLPAPLACSSRLVLWNWQFSSWTRGSKRLFGKNSLTPFRIKLLGFPCSCV